ncbi:hypothetical protein [Coleofasciculus sp. FACHB-SPT36]|uniref:hypothetical protein n=1 Tax=Cyanophyceae TaxID=3028117 RepID=UPI00168B56CE|nr:hypothetical protein [Coleofasciculus sp. FACHB-SPT36]MBD2540502.1 hypothetical protein [Coleofasciculus sp. FACHB-SPT36]
MKNKPIILSSRLCDALCIIFAIWTIVCNFAVFYQKNLLDLLLVAVISYLCLFLGFIGIKPNNLGLIFFLEKDLQNNRIQAKEKPPEKPLEAKKKGFTYFFLF